MTGNNILYSRSIILFDGHFDSDPILRLLKEAFTQLFAIESNNHL